MDREVERKESYVQDIFMFYVLLSSWPAGESSLVIPNKQARETEDSQQEQATLSLPSNHPEPLLFSLLCFLLHFPLSISSNSL